MTELPFWKRKRLGQMTRPEWESLCDGCARCCVHKLEDEESGEVFYTAVACKLLDLETCRCSSYASRRSKVPGCIALTPRLVSEFGWLPKTCAYRLLAEGKDLEWWHPLVSGNRETVHEAGISVRGRVFPEHMVDPENYEDFLLDLDNEADEEDDAQTPIR